MTDRTRSPRVTLIAALAAALTTFELFVGPPIAVAQTPPAPARAARPARPLPAPTPAPATSPTPAQPPTLWGKQYDGYNDPELQARREFLRAQEYDRMLDVKAKVDMSGLFERTAEAAKLAAKDAAVVARAQAMSQVESAWAASASAASALAAVKPYMDFTPMPALAPLLPTPPLPPQPPIPAIAPSYGFNYDFDFNFDFDARRDIERAYAKSFESFGNGYTERRIASVPPASWQANDPADSLYSLARRALTTSQYRRAAELFRKIRNDFPKSTYTPDAPYWEAFALQRLGNESDLRAAQDALSWQQKQYPKASTVGDATALSTRIDGALARQGDRDAYNQLKGRVNELTTQACPRENEDERVAALNALARMDTSEVLPVLKKVLARREPCTQALRRTAVWLYSSRRSGDAAQTLLNVARNDPDREVREQAVFWLANVQTDEAASMLVDLAKSGSDLELRKRAVASLSRSKSTRAASTLRDIATDANAPVELRADALQYYMNTTGRTSTDAVSFLRDVYARSSDDTNFRTRVLSIIASRKTDDAREFLTTVAQDQRENVDVRRSALSYLGNAGATAQQVGAIYDRNTNDSEIRKSAIGVLASLRDGAGTDKLLDVARNEKNPELRRQAVSYLSRTKDPRALQLLQEIILK